MSGRVSESIFYQMLDVFNDDQRIFLITDESAEKLDIAMTIKNIIDFYSSGESTFRVQRSMIRVVHAAHNMKLGERISIPDHHWIIKRIT